MQYTLYCTCLRTKLRLLFRIRYAVCTLVLITKIQAIISSELEYILTHEQTKRVFMLNLKYALYRA